MSEASPPRALEVSDIELAPNAEGLIYCGGRGPKHGLHFHSLLELNLVLEGSATCLVAGKEVSLSKHNALWLFPNQPHVLLTASEDFSFLMVKWAPAFAEGIGRSLSEPLLTTLQASAPVSDPLPKRVVRTLLEVAVDVREGSDVINHGLAYLLARAWSARREVSPPREYVLSKLVRDATTLLEQATTETSMVAIAAEVGTSYNHLAAAFKAELGVTLVEYRNRAAMERVAREYTRSRDLTRAAFDAGFGSYSQFFRTCVRLFGKGPREQLARHGGDPFAAFDRRELPLVGSN